MAAGDDGDARDARDGGDAYDAGDAGDVGGDNVYRPSLDFLTAGSNTSTQVETQFTGNDTFSLEELGIDVNADTPLPTEGVGRSAPKKKGKGKGKSKG